MMPEPTIRSTRKPAIACDSSYALWVAPMSWVVLLPFASRRAAP